MPTSEPAVLRACLASLSDLQQVGACGFVARGLHPLNLHENLLHGRHGSPA